MKFGDAIERVAKPIARTIDKATGTDIENCSGCQKRREALNRFGDFVTGWFTTKTKTQGEETMEVKVYEIQAKKLDNGYVIQAQQPNVQGTKKQLIATSDEDLQTKLKDLVDHIFDEPVKVERPIAVKPPMTSVQGKAQSMTGGGK